MFNFFGFQRRQTHTTTGVGHTNREFGQMESEIDRIAEESDQSEEEIVLVGTRSDITARSSPSQSPVSPQQQSACQSQTTSESRTAEEVAGGTAAYRPLPPSYQDVTNPRLWKVTLKFSTGDSFEGRYPVIEKATGWFGDLVVETADIVGLMQEGLCLSQENVKVQESYITPAYSQNFKTWYWDRHFTLVDPRWSGTMIVRATNSTVPSKFRIEHLTADHVYRGEVVDAFKTSNWYYCFTRNAPESNANYVLEDTAMKGLWPWPRKDLVP
ncbi:uncharacterized protein FTOL_07614 [Fusarium torulosum]|uniref:Uncharacterized protein n=1 Tax=Fusarium torulosum TaxID=33205 RepID=A0AAE8SJ71_9HYPO|nr:uncharacterized protein FTOL_07614 [Fusarium torulosum]